MISDQAVPRCLRVHWLTIRRKSIEMLFWLVVTTWIDSNGVQGLRQLGLFKDPFSGASDQDFDEFLKQFEMRAVKARWRDGDNSIQFNSIEFY